MAWCVVSSPVEHPLTGARLLQRVERSLSSEVHSPSRGPARVLVRRSIRLSSVLPDRVDSIVYGGPSHEGILLVKLASL